MKQYEAGGRDGADGQDVRHASIEELLALRDHEGTAWTKSHADSCPACAAELYRLEQVRARLKALPAFTPPRERWSRIAPAVRRERRQRLVRGVVGLATAAALTAITFVALRPSGSVDLAAERAALDEAMARSETMEQALKAMEPERRALTGDAARAVAELEDRLSRIDNALADPDAWRRERGQAVDLWQQRAGVLGALVDVHTTRAAMVSF